MKYGKKLVSILCVLSFIFALGINTAFAEDITPLKKINAEYYSVYAVNSGEYLVSHNRTTLFYPYSMIKMMTAIVAFDNADTDINMMPLASETVTVGREIDPSSLQYESDAQFLGEDYISAGFAPGDVVSLPDLIRAMILGNADDAAMTIAVYIGRKALGGVSSGMYPYDKDAFDKFVSMMNHKATLLGLKHTFFNNPTGVYSETESHSNTEDMAKIASEFINNKFLSSVISSGSINYWNVEDAEEVHPSVPDEGTVISLEEKRENAKMRVWKSFLPFIDEESEYYLSYCTPIVASETEEGIFLSVNAVKNDINVIVSVMAADKENVYSDVCNLLEYVFENYVLYTYIDEGQEIISYFVQNAMDPSNEHLSVIAGGTPALLSRKDKFDLFGYELRIDPSYFVSTEEDLFDKYVQPKATILKGTQIGTMDIYYNAVYKCSVPLLAGNTVPVHEDLPVYKKRGLLEKIDIRSIAFYAFSTVLIILILVFLVKLIINLRRPARARRIYAPDYEEKRKPSRYTKKHK